ELFIFKYLSDLAILKGSFSFKSLISRYDEDSDDEILGIYVNSVRPKIKELFNASLEDGTTIINGSVFINKHKKPIQGYSSVFRKVLLKFETYGKLENIDYDFKSQLFESFLRESISKKNWGQYFTPIKVVRAMVNMAKGDIREGISICDPACGVGKFLLESVVSSLTHLYPITSGSHIAPKITLHGFDKGFDGEEQKTIILAKANMLIYFSELIRQHPNITNKFSELFNTTFSLKYKSILGTLADPVSEKYDLILTNPPYVTSGSSNLKEEIQNNLHLSMHYSINALGIEGLFMEWIIRALKPGGKAYVVVPDGMLNRYNDRNLRRFILSECTLDGIISLPVKTFFTTDKKTSI
ncbi:MAG: SAM-dependent methyltransferase, partial [Lactobacillus sp.]|nr:SAM-dependent methyltransferase [Lactobacillus sp.]